MLAAAIDRCDRLGQQWMAAMGEQLLARSELDRPGEALGEAAIIAVLTTARVGELVAGQD